MTSPPPWSDLTYACDPGAGELVTVIAPVFSIALYASDAHFGAHAQFHDAAMALVKEGLTHYQAENMGNPARLTARALTMVPAWFSKPKKDHMYWWEGHGGADLGQKPPGIVLCFTGNQVTPEKAAIRAKNLAKRPPGELMSAGGTDSAYRIELPVDHALTQGPALVDWLLALDAVKRGEFSLIDCSYALSVMHGIPGVLEREHAWCSRYPGLDCFHLSDSYRLSRIVAGEPALVPCVRRAAWTLGLHGSTVRFLGGVERVTEALTATPGIRVVPLDHGGLLVQVGPRPELGDLSRGDDLPLLRAVARVIRPARSMQLADQSEFHRHFFGIFDDEHT